MKKIITSVLIIALGVMISACSTDKAAQEDASIVPSETTVNDSASEDSKDPQEEEKMFFITSVENNGSIFNMKEIEMVDNAESPEGIDIVEIDKDAKKYETDDDAEFTWLDWEHDYKEKTGKAYDFNQQYEQKYMDYDGTIVSIPHTVVFKDGKIISVKEVFMP